MPQTMAIAVDPAAIITELSMYFAIGARVQISTKLLQTITVDNGPEFADFARTEQFGTKVYFAHPYTSWERAQNERENGMLRWYVPKGVSIENFSDEEILWAADALNSLPRRNLGYCTPEELFDAFLDTVYAAWAAAKAPILIEADASIKIVADFKTSFYQGVSNLHLQFALLFFRLRKTEMLRFCFAQINYIKLIHIVNHSFAQIWHFCPSVHKFVKPV